jgi:hypothetical protein
MYWRTGDAVRRNLPRGLGQALLRWSGARQGEPRLCTWALGCHDVCISPFVLHLERGAFVQMRLACEVCAGNAATPHDLL